MGQYLFRRLLLAVPTLIGVSVLTFLFVRLMPGDVVASILGEYSAYAKDAADLRHKLGIDQPAPVQYARWVGHLLSGDLGTSLRTGRSVASEMRVRLPVTFEFGLLAMLASLLIALPVGILSAVRQDSVVDYMSRGLAVLMLSIPSFWLATLVITWPSIWWRWTPPVAYTNLWDGPVSNLGQVVIPVFILATQLSGAIMRLTRAQMLEILRHDYVRTAWSKGLSERTVIVRHALRNAFVPVITLIGLQVPVLIGGAVILENIFAIPGMGRYLLEAISTRDYIVVQAIAFLIAVCIVLTNIAVDMAYSLVDPRIRYTRGSR
jgi:peptide/nickel transport system permease protein